MLNCALIVEKRGLVGNEPRRNLFQRGRPWRKPGWKPPGGAGGYRSGGRLNKSPGRSAIQLILRGGALYLRAAIKVEPRSMPSLKRFRDGFLYPASRARGFHRPPQRTISPAPARISPKAGLLISPEQQAGGRMISAPTLKSITEVLHLIHRKRSPFPSRGRLTINNNFPKELPL